MTGPGSTAQLHCTLFAALFAAIRSFCAAPFVVALSLRLNPACASLLEEVGTDGMSLVGPTMADRETPPAAGASRTAPLDFLSSWVASSLHLSIR